MNISMAKAMAVVTLLALALAGIAYLKSERRFVAEAAAPIETPEREVEFRLGNIVVFSPALKGAKWAPTSATPQLAVTEERLSIAHDREGLEEMRDNGLLRYAKPGETARVIGFDPDPEATRKLGSGSEWIQVRFLDGPWKDAVGWAAAHDLKPEERR